MTTAVKICGITRIDDAMLCEKLGVEFIGLNLVPTSPRSIPPELAKKLRGSLKTSIPVLIFQDEKPETMSALAKEIGCTHIQCHGNEDPEIIGSLPLTVIKAYRFVPDGAELAEALRHVAYVMVDGTKNGQLTDLEGAAALPESIRSKLFVAGGLTPENVPDIIRRVRPFAVDTASGIESSPGVKDEKRVRAFVSAVRSASPTSR